MMSVITISIALFRTRKVAYFILSHLVFYIKQYTVVCSLR